MPAANDFICKVPCQWGPNAYAGQVSGQRAQLPPGIYDPPYRINNENSQVSSFVLTQSFSKPANHSRILKEK